MSAFGAKRPSLVCRCRAFRMLERVKPEGRLLDGGAQHSHQRSILKFLERGKGLVKVDEQGLSSTQRLSKEAKAAASSGLVATKCEDGRFLRFTALLLL